MIAILYSSHSYTALIAIRFKGSVLLSRTYVLETGTPPPFPDGSIGVVGCPLAGRKGNGVSYTLVQTRKSQKQRLQHNSASRAGRGRLRWAPASDADCCAVAVLTVRVTYSYS